MEKNLRKVPQRITIKLDNIESREVVIGCAKKFSRADIQDGILTHLNVNLDEEGLKFPSSIFPLVNQGKYSSWNINGREIKRTDLPKETYYNYIEAPNWGDSSYGYHTVALPGQRYPKEQIAPRNSTIEIECANISPTLEHYIVKFQISEVLNRDSPDFNDRLLYCLNLLQENIGHCDVEQAGVTLQDYIQTLHISWDILPPGTIEEAMDRMFPGGSPTAQERDTASERHEFFMSLNPRNLVYGRSGLQRYFGALIYDDLVVFENVKYGNAIYVMFDNWEELSQKSRVELLSGIFGDNFRRVIHSGDWREQVCKIIRDRA